MATPLFRRVDNRLENDAPRLIRVGIEKPLPLGIFRFPAALAKPDSSPHIRPGSQVLREGKRIKKKIATAIITRKG